MLELDQIISGASDLKFPAKYLKQLKNTHKNLLKIHKKKGKKVNKIKDTIGKLDRKISRLTNKIK